MSFHLIYLLKIQPSEVNQLTVPESRSYIRLYDDTKKREREIFEEQRANRNGKTSNNVIRRAPRRSSRRR